LPNYANAFWPFSTNADAAVNTFTPNSGPYLLSAATNSDPNPNKGLGDDIQTSGGKALLAYAGPSGTIVDVENSASSDRISVYVVRKGDTLSDIAKMFDVSINTIIWANNLKNASDVHPGDTLVILPISGIERTVVKGDTLKSLAKKYNADTNDIAQYNGIGLNDPLVVGTTIIIPGGEIIAPAPRPRPSPVIVSGGGSFLAGYYSNPVPGGLITQRLHGRNGIDIGAARGTPVYATAEGTIIIARGGGAWNGGYGNYVVITHNNGTQTLYSHLRSTAVSPGQSVSQGQTIGYVGSTGKVTGTHLHFEVRGAQNPLINCRVGSICSPQ
jgi:murein DD-endopeptidase MepM/ murein hydrolase activator NlpD